MPPKKAADKGGKAGGGGKGGGAAKSGGEAKGKICVSFLSEAVITYFEKG